MSILTGLYLLPDPTVLNHQNEHVTRRKTHRVILATGTTKHWHQQIGLLSLIDTTREFSMCLLSISFQFLIRRMAKHANVHERRDRKKYVYCTAIAVIINNNTGIGIWYMICMYTYIVCVLIRTVINLLIRMCIEYS